MKNSCKLYINSFDTKLWKDSLKIEFLKSNIGRMESIIEGYLNDIRNDFPQLTDHSLDHSNMLWNYSNIIVGDKNKYLNPLEGFVLHAVFLIHDAGMCYSILNNRDEIEKDPLFKDYLVEYGNSDHNVNEALFYTVRSRHGEYALKIATEELKHGDFLIENTELREELSLIIGKIAKSHTLNINYIERELDYYYTSPSYPVDWSIDCTKLAFILRTADAAHLDNLRTPKTIKLINELGEVSKNHWIFQKKLGFPRLSDENTLIYNSNSPFNIYQQKAWWYCFNAFKVLDKELKLANEYFEINGKEPFCARGVKAINDTLLMGKKYVRAEGWETIDTQVKVSNPVHIATELGGIKLYGKSSFALREIIQNSIDAINLHRLHTGQENTNLGEIKVSIEEEGNEFYLVVTDNGIGMSPTLLCNELLDFGGSYWKSNRFNFDFEGIRTKGFQSIGKFGIGFFSIFMLGNNITVTSWKFGEAIDKMKTLDFYDGLFYSPILRNPASNEKERILDRGTSIRIKLKMDPYTSSGFIGDHRFIDNRLFSLVKYYVPGCNVKISIRELDGQLNIIEPNYPYNINLNQILDYFPSPVLRHDTSDIIKNIKKLNLELIDVSDDKRNYGKLAILPGSWGNVLESTALILSKGVRVSDLRGFIGYIFTDDIISIKRDKHSKLVPYETLKEWAFKQKTIIESSDLVPLYFNNYLSLLLSFGFYNDDFPLLLSKSNNSYKSISTNELKKILKENSNVNLYLEATTVAARSPECDGFIYLNLNLSFKQVITEKDEHKIISYYNVVENLIQEVWGEFDFEVERIGEKFDMSLFDSPYVLIHKYNRKF